MLYLNAKCIKYKFRIFILLHIKKHYFIQLFCFFKKIVESLQRILKIVWANIFSIVTQLRSLEIFFTSNLLLLRLLSRETELQQRPKFGINISKNNILQFELKHKIGTKKLFQVQQGSIYGNILLFSTKNKFLFVSKELKTKRKLFNIGPNICKIFHILAQVHFNTSETKLHYYHQKVNLRVV